MSEPLRALMVDSERTWRGGEGQLLLLMRGLLGQGLEVGLAAPEDSEIRRRSAHLDIRFHPVPISGGMDVVSAWKLRGAIRREGYDVVHSHSSHAHGVAFLACAAMDRAPLQVVSRRVDFDVAGNPLSAMKYRHGADVYLAISNGVRDALLRGGIPEDRIRLVRSAVDLEKFHSVGASRLREEFGVADGIRVVGNVAALAPHKSQEDFISAAGEIRSRRDDVRFFIVGDGNLRARLEAQARRLQLGEALVFTGFREDALNLLVGFDCFVISSYLEGLCTSIMDAQSLGIPVVATRTGGIPDIVADGVTGLLAPPREPSALAAAIERMLDDKSLSEQCVSAAREQSRGYDYREMVYKTVGVYRDLCQRSAESPVKGAGR